jgi:hypothetical protein
MNFNSSFVLVRKMIIDLQLRRGNILLIVKNGKVKVKIQKHLCRVYRIRKNSNAEEIQG